MKVVEEKLAKFEGAGDCVEGQLMDVDSVQIGGKTVQRYILLDEQTGQLTTVLGTESLKKKIFKPMVGRSLRITLTGHDKKYGGESNPMKIFEVQIA